MLRHWQTFQEQRKLQRLLMLRQPVRPVLELVQVERGPYSSFGLTHFTPWMLSLHIAPLTADGDIDDQADMLDGFTHDPELYREPADLAAIQVQRRIRGIFSRRRVAHLRDVAKTILTGVLGRVFDDRDHMINFVRNISDVSVERSMLRQTVAAHCIKHVISETVNRSINRQAVVAHSVKHIISETVERSWNRSRVARHCVDFIFDRAIEAHHYRQRQIIKIQSAGRGRLERKKGNFHLKRVEMMRKAIPKIKMWQAIIRRNKAQVMLSSNIDAWRRETAAIRMQKHARSMMAVKAVAELRRQRVWLLHMWFDYAPIGTASVQASVRIVENEKFDPYQYFLENPGEELAGNLEEMVEAVDVCVTSYLTELGEDLLADEVLPEPVEIMPEFQHASIRNAMETLQSIDFEAVHAETAVALEAAAALGVVAQGQDPAAVAAAEEALAELEREEALEQLGDLRAQTPGGPMSPVHGAATPSAFDAASDYSTSQYLAQEQAGDMVGGMMDRALREPEMEGVSPLPTRAMQSAGAFQDQPEPGPAAPAGFALMPVR